MGILRRRGANHLIPIHRDNSATKDWAILLEAGTIVGPSPQRIRVAQATQDKKIKRRYDILLRAKYFILVEGYNPRIHTLYFCPQLYRYDGERKLVPLQGEEIGQLIAQAAKAGVTERRTAWFRQVDKAVDRPQQMIRRHMCIEREVVEQHTLFDMPGSHHRLSSYLSTALNQ
jgi:hypothetical protein